MREPKMDFARDLRRQGLQSEETVVQRQRRGGPSMVVPGEGGVVPAPGSMREIGSRGSRSAAHFGPIVGSRYGGGSASE
jgi:hypothetical protein